jgi:hypothetical protein
VVPENYFQNLARRENACKSTGPKTEAGKARSLANSVNHGLTGSGVVLSPEMQALYDQRRYALRAKVRRRDRHTGRVEDEAVLASLRLDACRIAQRRRVEECWDNDRRLAVLALARELSERPEETSIRLEQTAHGAAWKLEKWQSLAEALDDHGTWTPEEIALALDLMGMPRSGRPGHDAVCDAETCRLLLDGQRERLMALKTDVLDPTDESERLEAMLGVPHDQSKEANLYRRYEAEHWRKYMALTKQLDLHVRKGNPPEPPVDHTRAQARVPAPMPVAPVAPIPSVRPVPSVPAVASVPSVPAPATTASTGAVPSPAARAAVSRDEAGDRRQGLEGSHRPHGRPEEGRPLFRRGRPIR